MRMQRRQRGVAVVTALLLTTLAISIVASLFWQQQVQVRSMENQRLQLQTQWIERGALDWAALVLQQDRQDNAQYTSLDQIWATPLAETRLDQYIERERVQGERYDATLSGSMIDACSRYNLFNLASGGAPDKPQVEVFQRLLKNLQIDPELAARTAYFVAASQGLAKVSNGTVSGGGGSGGGGAGTGDTSGGTGDTGGDTAGGAQGQSSQKPPTVMKLVQLDDLLAIPGWTPELVQKLRPFAIVLPANTSVNVNTAPAEVLASLAPGLSLMTANSLVARRKQAPYKDANQFSNEAMHGQGDLPVAATVRSDWFLVESHIRLDRASLNVEALVSRVMAPALKQIGPHVVWIRQI
jgi:general secretion pathway protein K